MIPTTYDLLAAHPFLAGMPPEQVAQLAPWARRRLFHARARIFSEGGHAERCWLIREGRVTLDAQVPGRGEVVVDTLGPGSVLGWSWLFPPYRWHFGAVAAEQTLAVELDAPGLRRLSEEDPRLGRELYRRFLDVVVDRLQATRRRMLEAGTVPPEPATS